MIKVLAALAMAILLLACQQNSELKEPEQLFSQGEQIVRIKIIGPDFVPSDVTVKKDIPVRLMVDASKAYGCMNYFKIKKYEIDTELKKGDNEFKFTPTEKENIPFSCSMEMAKGVIRVK